MGDFSFCFFKQKTAYEMRISDWSSDVCSSDLSGRRSPATGAEPSGRRTRLRNLPQETPEGQSSLLPLLQGKGCGPAERQGHRPAARHANRVLRRSDERRVGKESVSTCSYRGSWAHYKKNKKKQRKQT